ncbi:MAG: c-type cytochrome [Anaerolineae bacterium]
MKKRNIPFVILIVASFVVILIACSRSQAQQPAADQPVAHVEQPIENAPAVDAPPAEAEHAEAEAEHQEAEAEHEEAAAHQHSPEDHMAGHHEVPEKAAAVPNPFSATDESIKSGAAVFAQSCAVCHGETGKGDGPAAETLEVKPANLHEGHVQGLSDGALFYIISHGRPESPMPAWDNILTEEQRWHVVNFLRTFKDAGTHEEAGEHEHADEADDHHHDDKAGDDHHHDEHRDDDGHTHSEGDSR